jgi:hypothetical protein
MRAAARLGAGSAVLACVLAQAAAGAPALSKDLAFTFKMGPIPGGTGCPEGTPASSVCIGQSGSVEVKGLGTVHVDLVHIVDPSDSTCPKGTVTGDLKTAHGALSVTGSAAACVNTTFGLGTYAVTLTGSGGFAGASGSGTIGNAGTYLMNGTLHASNAVFDVVRPTISGAVNRTVKTTAALGARVTFAVKAHDDADDAVRVTCTPKSGSLFRVGRTRVTCRAVDSSANAATRSFTVTVKRA